MKHSAESKKKLSEARKKFLKENPDKKSWQTKEYHKSIPCELIKDYLTEQNIQFIDEFSPLLEIGRFFSIDIAFPDKKIGLEINGRQHYDNEGNLTEYYQERHNLIESFGWKLYEIPYHCAFKKGLIIDIINKILNSNIKLYFDYLEYRKVNAEKQALKIKRKQDREFRKINGQKYKTPPKHPYPSDDELLKLAPQYQLKDLSELLKIPKKALFAYLKERNIKTKMPYRADEKRRCPLCQGRKSEASSHCRKCSNELLKPIRFQKRTHQFTKEQLEKLVWEKSIERLAKELDITGNTIRKWCKQYNIEVPPRGYWQKLWKGNYPPN